MPWFALIVTVGAGWLIIKRFSTAMVLLFAGLAMLLFAVFCGVHGFLPKGVKPSGFVLFDIFDLLRTIAAKQTSGTGFLIMVAGGYAAYMDRIGAASALVNVCTKPLKALSSPYLVLVLGYLIGQALVTVIPSAAGLAMLLLVALFPILLSVGVSPAAAASVIGTSAGMTLGPASGTANLAAKVAGLDPIIYFVQCQLPVALPTLIVVAAAHYFVQKYYDKKGDDVYQETALTKKEEPRKVPGWYAVLPCLPIVLMIIFSKLVYKAVTLNTISALLLVWVLTVIIEMVRRREVKEVLKDGVFIFKSMGGMFASIVALIICAEFFATGLKVTGLIDMLIKSAQGLGLGLNGMTVVLTAVVGVVTFLTGSGVGAFSSFAALAPDVAGGLGGTAAAFVTPMQYASGMLRAMSPVAGVIIAVAGAAGVAPMAIVRRNWLPMLLGMLTVIISNWLFLG
jgi:DcuC family C4-dicarboxylate transporter